jgi:hypothetical protein
MHDAALNIGSVTFSQEPNDEAPAFIDVVTASPDLEAPELDLGSIWLAAEPTNPEAPNGETRVTIEYFARDDAAGLDTVSYQLRDPQGIGHFEYHYHDEFYTVFFSGDATAWRRYEINVTLPIGSAPGIWGLSEMSLLDKANNRASYDFTEILHFDVE